MNICDSCNNNFNTQYNKFYNDQFKNLSILFKNSIINNFDILNEIFSYLSYKNHKVTHQLKKRIFPKDDEYDSDFDDEIYWDETKNICTFCFQTGLIESLEVQKRLPFLRRDIYFFLNEERNFEEYMKKYKKEYKNFYYNYKLPINYENTFYRQEQPELINNRLIIKNK